MKRFTNEIIGYISLFEDLTGARVKDCCLNNELLFIVEEGDARKAIGKNGANVQRISKLMNRRIKVVEYSDKVEEFVKSLISPVNGKIYKEDSAVKVEIKGREKALVLGKNKHNIKLLQEIVLQYFKLRLIIL